MWLSDEDYNFIYSKSPRFCVDLVLACNDDRVYLAEREEEPYKGKWSLPGGKVNFRETIDQAINRIANRELKRNVTVNRLIGFMEFLDETQNGNDRHSISIVFDVTIDDRKTFFNPRGATQKEIEKNYDRIVSNLHPIHEKFLYENGYGWRI